VELFGYYESPEYIVLLLGYVEGLDLATLLRQRQRLDEPRAALVFVQLLRGLEHVHGRGVVHRDVKPGNLLVTPAGRAYLIDFGLAVAADEMDPAGGGDDCDYEVRVVGTLGYLAPEILLGHVSGWSGSALGDVWAAGVMLYEAVFGFAPLLPHEIVSAPVEVLPPPLADSTRGPPATS